MAEIVIILRLFGVDLTNVHLSIGVNISKYKFVSQIGVM